MLSNREVWAIAGEWYREAAGLNADDPGAYEGWDAYRDDLLDARTFPDGDPTTNPQRPIYEPDEQALTAARECLTARGVLSDPVSVEAVAAALWVAKVNFAALMMRRADTADRRLDAGCGQALGVFDRDILAAAIAVVDEPAAMGWPALVQSLFKSIEDERGMSGAG